MIDQTATTQPTNEVAMLLDGTKLPGKLRPKAEGKAPEEIDLFVRKIPICDMECLARVWGKYTAEVATYLERDMNFVKTLSDETFTAVLEEGRRLNFTSFEKWFSWQGQTLKALGQQQDTNEIVQAVFQKLGEQKAAQAAEAPSASA